MRRRLRATATAGLAAILGGWFLLGAAGAPGPQVFTGGPLPIGREFLLEPSNYSWALAARAGEHFKIRVEWPDGAVVLKVGSDHRGENHDEEDDASDKRETPGRKAGRHAQTAAWQIGPTADTAFIELHLIGRGASRVHVRIDRAP